MDKSRTKYITNKIWRDTELYDLKLNWNISNKWLHLTFSYLNKTSIHLIQEFKPIILCYLLNWLLTDIRSVVNEPADHSWQICWIFWVVGHHALIRTPIFFLFKSSLIAMGCRGLGRAWQNLFHSIFLTFTFPITFRSFNSTIMVISIIHNFQSFLFTCHCFYGKVSMLHSKIWKQRKHWNMVSAKL